jgi:hypothetical protein
MFALRFFERRRKHAVLEPALRRDVRAFFGSNQAAEKDARELLFSVKDRDVINRACKTAFSLGLGLLEAEHSLQLHTSLIERLPAPLRVYIGGPTAIVGNRHIRSR